MQGEGGFSPPDCDKNIEHLTVFMGKRETYRVIHSAAWPESLEKTIFKKVHFWVKKQH